MFHTDYYFGPRHKVDPVSSLPENYYRIENDLRKAHSEELRAGVSDFRFNENIEYQGIENSTLMRLNACAFLSLHFWCLNPSCNDYSVLKPYCHIVLKPMAAAFDAFANFCLTIGKIAFTALIFIGKGFQKLYGEENVGFWKSADMCSENITHQLYGALIPSLQIFFYQIFGGCLINLAGPEYDGFFRLFSIYHWGYYVNKDEFILDTNRVKYLREKCGWEDVSDETFKTVSRPWISSRISYSKRDEHYYIQDNERRWITSRALLTLIRFSLIKRLFNKKHS